jgi:hypothetical protein
MSKEEGGEENGRFVDCEVIVDGLGITHFLPPRRCKNCDD